MKPLETFYSRNPIKKIISGKVFRYVGDYTRDERDEIRFRHWDKFYIRALRSGPGLFSVYMRKKPLFGKEEKA